MPDPSTDPNSVTVKSKPSRGWYAVAAVIGVVSLVIYLYALSVSHSESRAALDEMHRFVAPGQTRVEVNDPGPVTIFYENRGSLGDRDFDTMRRQVWPERSDPAMSCTITGPGEVDIEAALSDMVEIYETGPREGHAVWQFEAGQPGEYVIDVQYVTEPIVNADTEVLLAVGRLEAARIHEGWTTLYLGAAALAFGGTAAVVMALVVFMIRHARTHGLPGRRDEHDADKQ